MTHPTRGNLRPLPLSNVLPGALIMTMGIGQWDALLARAYDDGWTLIELDENEVPIRAYRKHYN